MNSASLQDTRSMYKNQLYFYLTAMNNPEIQSLQLFPLQPHVTSDHSMGQHRYRNSHHCRKFIGQHFAGTKQGLGVFT